MAWELFVNKKANQSYQGKAERCTYHFSLWPEQIPGVRWTAQQVANAHVEELEKQGSRLLELRMWEDTEPVWKTDYYVEVVATASPLLWSIIITGVLVIIVGLIVYFTIDKIDEIVDYVGEKAPFAIPLLAIAGVGVLVLAGIALVKGRE